MCQGFESDMTKALVAHPVRARHGERRRESVPEPVVSRRKQVGSFVSRDLHDSFTEHFFLPLDQFNTDSEMWLNTNSFQLFLADVALKNLHSEIYMQMNRISAAPFSRHLSPDEGFSHRSHSECNLWAAEYESRMGAGVQQGLGEAPGLFSLKEKKALR